MNILKDKFDDLNEIPYLDSRIEELKPEDIVNLSNLLYQRKFQNENKL